jgi:DNA-binding SARP family transcriptional activator
MESTPSVKSQRVQVNLLGTPHAILQDGEIVQFQVDNTLLLMAMLGSQPGKVLRRTELAALFYPDHDDQHASQNIRQVIHRLRKLIKDDTLDPPGLLVDSLSIRINPDGPIVTDIQILNEKYKEVQKFTSQHSHRRFNICHTCKQYQDELAEFYTGDFMAGYETHMNTQLDDWIPNLQQEFRTRLLITLHWLSDYHFERQQYKKCDDYLARLTRIEPLDEAALRMRMQIWTINGQRNQALVIFHDFQRKLQQYLNVIPEEETILLAQAIRTGKSIGTAITNSIMPFANHEIDGKLLPDTTLFFFDRSAEIQQIIEHLDSGDQRVIVIKGVIGSGKTRLALHIASLEHGAWADGIYLVMLTRHTPPNNSLVSALVQALGVPTNNSSEHRKNLISFLREKECLILLDNLDEIPDQAEVIQSLVNLCPKIKFIITTRKHLGIRGEKVIYFHGLEYPSLQNLQADVVEIDKIDLEIFINKYSALQLYREIAGRAKADFVLDAANMVYIIQTCEMLMGLPLGIELAASYARLFTSEEIRDGVYGCLNGIEGVSTFIADRHGNFKKRFEQVWETLDQTQRDLVKIVYQYPDGVVTDNLLAEKLTTIETLVTLQDRSTLIRLPGSRVKLHPLVRFFCNQ